MSANVRLWLHPPGQTDAQVAVGNALSLAAASRFKAFNGYTRESADTWLFSWKSGGSSLTNSSYAAFKRYIGQAIPSTMGLRPETSDPSAVVWGRDVGNFPWPAVTWQPPCVAATSACEEAPPLAHTPAAGEALQASELTTCCLPFKAFALFRDGADSLGPYSFEAGGVSHQGAYGIVHRARDTVCGEIVAIKLQKRNIC